MWSRLQWLQSVGPMRADRPDAPRSRGVKPLQATLHDQAESFCGHGSCTFTEVARLVPFGLSPSLEEPSRENPGIMGREGRIATRWGGGTFLDRLRLLKNRLLSNQAMVRHFRECLAHVRVTNLVARKLQRHAFYLPTHKQLKTTATRLLLEN